MSKKALSMALILTVVVSAYATGLVYGGGCGSGGGGCGGGCNGGSTTQPLSEYEKQALSIAINEEYKARAIYREVLDQFSPIDPFTWILRDEQMHVNWLANLHAKYGLKVPQDQWSGNVALDLDSKQQACELGAQAETDNAAAYDDMLPQITHSDIASTFTKLRDVSQYRHLPAFQRWADIYESIGE